MTAAAQPADLSIVPTTTTSERPNWWRALFWASFLSIYFIIVYGFCNWFTAERHAAGEHILTFYWEWERHIPLIPAFIIPYMSIDLFFFAAPFLCTDLRELRINLISRTRLEDDEFTRGMPQALENRNAAGFVNDGYRRRVLVSSVRLRNLGMRS